MKNLDKCSIIEAVDLEDSNIYKTGKQIKDCIKENRIFLIGTDVKEKLYEVIEQISKKTNVNLTSVRFAYEINFKYKIILHRKTETIINSKKVPIIHNVRNIKTFSEIVKYLNYDENGLLCNYSITIDDTEETNTDNIRNEIVKLSQQFVFLNFDVDIFTKSENDKKNKIDNFKENCDKIIKNIDILCSKIDKILFYENISNKIFKEKRKILWDIKTNIEKIKSGSIRIAVMGTKKAGKSVIVNSLLNCDYAPTSLELPTPNNVFYIPNNKDDRLYLEYEDKKQYFDCSEDLKKYITDEFEKAKENTGQGSALPDMFIYYPSNDLTGFEIIDTPGPNFAGAGKEHEKKTEKAIKIADVCIFVINYSTHLTDDEITYFQKIRNSLTKDKLNSLLIAVNRIDERYSSNVKKSVTRIIDYMKYRLEELNYKNLLVFPTSALQSFYLEKISQYWEEYKNESVSLCDINAKIVKKLKIKYCDEDEKMTQLRFIEKSFIEMEDFHRIEEGNGEQLYLLSGIPKLKKYCRYIVEQRINRNIIDLTSKLDEIKKIENLISEYKIENRMKKLEKCSIIEPVDLDESNINDTIRYIKANIKINKIFLLGTVVKEKLHEVIDKISRESKLNLTSARFAYELNFRYPTVLRKESGEKKEIEVKKFSELLENLDYDENGYIKGKFLVVIDDKPENGKENIQDKDKENIQKEIATLFQQIVFLNLDFDICTRTELEIKAKKDYFRKHYKEILDAVSNSFVEIEKIEKDKKIDGKDLTKETFEKVTKIKTSLSIIKKGIEDAKARPIRIAVMGTKKAGKSVIINSLLNCDYAPTSLELPTPNNIIYTPNNKDNRLCLEYNGEKRYFDTADKLKQYITNEFEIAQDKTGKGSDLPDMTIYYPSDTLTGFEVIEIPAPNFSSSWEKYAKKTEEAIKIADVGIFVINYSRHLTTDEADYLAKIRNYFKEHDKFYSLFITVNRIDERYSTDVEKSVIRIIDYIRNRLEDLQYNNISVFGTSALQSFYLEKVRQIQKEYIQEEYNKNEQVLLENINEDIVKKLKRKYIDDDEKLTPLNFIGKSFTEMKDFHKMKNGNGEQLSLLSGMPQLKKYCRYIVEQKTNEAIIDIISKLGEIKQIENLISEYEIKNKEKIVREELKSEKIEKVIREELRIENIKKRNNNKIIERRKMKKLEKCSIIEPVDLNESNINDIAKNIKANIKIFLLGTDVNLKLEEVIDKISKESKVNLTSGRFAYELNFKYPTVLRKESGEKKEIEVKKFSELLENLDYDENGYIKGKFLVVIDDKQEEEKENIQKEIATLFQQSVFLNLDLDICTRTELDIKAKKDHFRKHYKEILDSVENSFGEIAKIEEYKKIDGKDLTDETFEKVTKIKTSLSIIKKGIEDAKARPIRIAVMGTKKAGKSVIINSLLNCDYAPTSLELPTPNNIIYTPNNKDNRLCLKYNDEEKYFDTADKLKKYITDEFEKAKGKTDEGSDLPDMTIYYPSDTLTGFEILDTPGPNFAGAGDKHAKKTEEAIKIADVCLFVINYSTHLTKDESDYLAKIRNYFKEHDKFYSLFITVNRIDERYSTDVEKSVIRIIDYIRNRLEELQYNNISVFGTSALQSFYLEKVRQIQKEYIQEEYNKNEQVLLGNINEDIVKKLKRKYRDDDEKLTPLNFIGKSFTEMEDFHKMEEGNGEQLNLLSGMPQLDRYCHYIGEQKADTEIVNAVLFKVDMNLADIKNKFFLKDLKELVESLGEEIEELKSDVKRLQVTAEDIFAKLNVNKYEEQIRIRASEEIKYNIEELYTDFEGDLTDITDDIRFDKDSVYRLMENEYKISTDIKDRINKSLYFYNSKIIGILDKRLGTSKVSFANILEEKFKGCSVKIQEEYDKIKAKVKTVTLQNIIDRVSIPNVSFSVQQSNNNDSALWSSFDCKINSNMKDLIKKNTKIQSREYTRDIFDAWNDGSDFFESFGNVFVTVRNKFRECFGSNKVYRDNADLDKVKEEYVKYMKDSIKKIFDGNIKSYLDIFAKKQEEEVFKFLSNQCKVVKDFYNNTFRDFYEALDKLSISKTSDKEKNEKQIEELTYIESKLKDVYKSFEFLEERI